MNELAQKDLKYIWHPCSQMKDYETLLPIVIDHGEGIYLYDTDGKRYVDVISSWWCNLLGHCNPKINAAVKNQIDKLEHVITSRRLNFAKNFQKFCRKDYANLILLTTAPLQSRPQ